MPKERPPVNSGMNGLDAFFQNVTLQTETTAQEGISREEAETLVKEVLAEQTQTLLEQVKQTQEETITAQMQSLLEQIQQLKTETHKESGRTKKKKTSLTCKETFYLSLEVVEKLHERWAGQKPGQQKVSKSKMVDDALRIFLGIEMEG